jgi:hypothetical protein
MDSSSHEVCQGNRGSRDRICKGDNHVGRTMVTIAVTDRKSTDSSTILAAHVHNSDNDTTDRQVSSKRRNGVERVVTLSLGGKYQPRAPLHLRLYYPWLVATPRAHEHQAREEARKISTTFLSGHASSSTVTCCILHSPHATLSGNGGDVFWDEERTCASPTCESPIHGRRHHTTNYNTVTTRTTHQFFMWMPKMLSIMGTG